MALDTLFVRLLSDLLNEFRGCDAPYPRLPSDRVVTARSLLKALITDHDTVDAYMQVVSPRLAEATPPPDMAYEEQCFAVIERGVDAINSDSLAMLLLDPVGVMNIHLAVEQETPDAWRKDLAANGRELRSKYGVLPVPHSSTAGSGAVQHT